MVVVATEVVSLSSLEVRSAQEHHLLKFKNLFKAVVSGVLFKLVPSGHLQRQCDGLGFCDVKSLEESEMHL